MNELLIYRAASLFMALMLFFLALWTVRLKPERLNAVEALPRNPLWGMILGWIALIWCVPHAEAVAPGFLMPLLWPLALIVPVLGYFFLDYALARAAGGLMILTAYYFVHASFEHRAPGAPVLAVLCWCWGIGGIWISGKPAAMRDWLRLVCRSRLWRNLSAVWFALFGCAILTVMLLTWKGNGNEF